MTRNSYIGFVAVNVCQTSISECWLITPGERALLFHEPRTATVKVSWH